MDSIKAQKLQAQKNYKRAQFLYNLIVYSLTAFLSTLFYLYMFWFPSTKHFFSMFAPNIYSFLLSPKVLFVVGNVIVLFLVGESKRGRGGGGSKYSSPAADIYDKYVQRSRSLRERSARLETYKKNKNRKVVEMHASMRKCVSLDGMSAYLKDEMKKETEILQTNKNGEEAVGFLVNDHPVDGKRGRGDEEEEEKINCALSNDELNRRVEAFIARVNRQRRLEEGQVL